MHGLSDPAPRILAKELTPLSLNADLCLERIYQHARVQRCSISELVDIKKCGNVGEEEKKTDTSLSTEKDEIDATENNCPPQMIEVEENKKTLSIKGKRRRLKATCYMEDNMMYLPHLKQAFERVDEINGKKKDDGKGTPKSTNPLAAKMNFANKGPIPAINNSNTTGVSIAQGSYLNKDNTNQPTWKALIDGD